MGCGRGRRVRVNGLGLQLYEWGAPESPPARLLHSLAGHSHWWDWTAPLLADRFHVIALDLRGHGGSEWVEPPAYRAGDHVADIIAVLGELGWRSPLVIGHSLGGYVGINLAASHHDRVGALVIADTMTEWSDEEAAWAARTGERPEPRFASLDEAASRFRLQPAETAASLDRIRHLAEKAVTERRPGVWQYGFDRRMFADARPDVWPILPRVSCPVLAVRGEKSAIMSRESWQRVAATVEHGHLAQIEGAYHHLILDDPDQFAAVVTGWLTTVAGLP